MSTILLEDMTEKTVQYSYIGKHDPLPIQQVGDAITYFDEIYNADGETIGRAVGLVTATHLAPNGHLMTHYEDAVELPEGTLRSSGAVDRQEMLEGACIKFAVVGTSGKFLGLSGLREWQLILPVTTMTVNLRISLG
jgi:hypothetical protein